MTFGNPNPLVVEFQTKFYIKIGTIVMEYTDFQLIWRFESMIFKAKHFFREQSLFKLCVFFGQANGSITTKMCA